MSTLTSTTCGKEVDCLPLRHCYIPRVQLDAVLYYNPDLPNNEPFPCDTLIVEDDSCNFSGLSKMDIFTFSSIVMWKVTQ